MPRLLLLTSTFPRWEGDSVTPFVRQLGDDLSDRGWDVTVLAPHAAGSPVATDMGSLHVRRFRYLLPARAQTLAYGGGALLALRSSPAAVAQLPLFLAAQSAATARLVAGGRFDAVHSHWVLPQGAAASTWAPRRGLPHLATAHGSDVLGLGGRALHRAKAWALSRADAITVNSSATEEAVRRLVPRHTAVHRVPMGVTLADEPGAAEVEALRATWVPGGGPLVAYVGRLVGWKGVADLLDAVALVPELTCVVVGDGPDAPLLRAQAEESGIGDRVVFAGWTDAADVPKVLAAADVLVFPSRREADGTTEGQGLAILEAMASRTPVVATAVGGIPDSIVDGEHGLLVDQRDPVALAAAVGRLLADPALARRLGDAARRRVAARFTRAASADAFDGVLRELVSRSS